MSENAVVEERFIFDADGKRYNYVATFNDPTVYARPWTATIPARRYTEADEADGWHYEVAAAKPPRAATHPRAAGADLCRKQWPVRRRRGWRARDRTDHRAIARPACWATTGTPAFCGNRAEISAGPHHR